MKTSHRISLAAGAIAAAVSVGAHAEYRCATPGILLLPERHACELAQQGAPDALVHFVNRTKGTYNLYVYDYVKDADADRSQQSKQFEAPSSMNVAEVMGDVQKTSKFD